MNLIRRKVSQNKNRLVRGKFDLDLTYITDRIIAMGFPAVGLEFFYRNPRQDVQEFLDTTHGSHYRVYNLCAEKDYLYDRSVFHGRVSNYPFPDHKYVYPYYSPPIRITITLLILSLSCSLVLYLLSFNPHQHKCHRIT